MVRLAPLLLSLLLLLRPEVGRYDRLKSRLLIQAGDSTKDKRTESTQCPMVDLKNK